MADWFDGNGKGATVDVVAILDSQAHAVLYDIVQLGAMVSLGTTRDGGALAVTITVDGRWRREYFREEEELMTWLEEAVPAVRQALDAIAASSERGSKARRTRGL